MPSSKTIPRSDVAEGRQDARPGPRPQERHQPPEALPGPADNPAVRAAGAAFVSGRIGRERYDAIVERERKRFVRRRVREVAASLRGDTHAAP